MPNRTLALDVGGTTLRAALVESTLRSSRVLGLYAGPRTPGVDLGTDLRAFLAKHALQWDEVVSVLPGDLVTHRILRLPFRDRRRLDQTVPFELESHLPFELDEAVVDYHVLASTQDETVVLGALAPKAAVREHLAALAAAGIDPRVLDLAPLAALNLLRLAHAGGKGHTAFLGLGADRTAIALLHDGVLVGLRTLSRGAASAGDRDDLIRDIRWSLLSLAGDASLESIALWLGGEAAATPGLADAIERALGAAPRGLDTLPIAAVPAALQHEQAAFATPLGLAVRQRAADGTLGVDFRRGEFAYHREREALWRGLAGTGFLVLVAIVLMVVAFGLEARQLQGRRDAVRADIRSLFTSILPGTRTIVNEKAQLASELGALEKQRKTRGALAPSAPRAIDLLRALTTAVPADVLLDIDELALDGETLRVRGSARTYDSVEAVKRGLAARPEFRDVQAKDVRTTVDGQRVDFRLSMMVAQGDGQ